jgi:hypothetical protein
MARNDETPAAFKARRGRQTKLARIKKAIGVRTKAVRGNARRRDFKVTPAEVSQSV